MSSAVVYFRDAKSFVMAPLEYLFASAGSQFTFTEKATWGINVHDGFRGGHYAIIGASILIKEDDLYAGGGGRNKVGGIAAAATQGLRIADRATGGVLIDKAASSIGGALGGLSGGAGTSGGIPNILNVDSLKNELASDPAMSRPATEAFLARVKNADKYLVKVPIRFGSQVTVGKGVTNNILAPAGPASTPLVVGGQMLVADMMHDCYFDQRTLMGTSTMRAVKVSDVI